MQIKRGESQNIMLNEKNTSQKAICHMAPLICAKYTKLKTGYLETNSHTLKLK